MILLAVALLGNAVMSLGLIPIGLFMFKIQKGDYGIREKSLFWLVFSLNALALAYGLSIAVSGNSDLISSTCLLSATAIVAGNLIMSKAVSKSHASQKPGT